MKFLNLLELCFNIWYTLENALCDNEKIMYPEDIGWDLLLMSEKSIWCLVQIKFQIFFAYFLIISPLTRDKWKKLFRFDLFIYIKYLMFRIMWSNVGIYVHISFLFLLIKLILHNIMTLHMCLYYFKLSVYFV